MKRVKMDVMVDERYYGTMWFEYSPIFTIREQDIAEQVERQYPTLKGRDYYVAF